MSGILIRVKGASFEANAVGFIPPVADGLEYWNFFSGGANKVTRNLALGKAGSTLVGVPTYNADSAVFTAATAYLQTGVDDTAEMTFIAVAKPLIDASAHIISSFSAPRVNGAGGGNSQGKSLWFTGGSSGDGLVQAVAAQARWDGVGSSSTLTSSGSLGLPVGQWQAITGLMGPTSNQLRLPATGFIDTDTPLLQPDLSTGKLRIGSATVGNASVEIAFAAIYNRVLSAQEADDVYAFLKGYYSRRGIAI